MSLSFDTFPTSFGPFSVAVDRTGAVAAAAFGGLDRLRSRVTADTFVADPGHTREAREQLLAYFAGTRRNFTLRLAPQGTVFQQRVWAALRAIPTGETRTYGELATELGSPRSARAVGRANATNPICVIVPCHRVIGADGSLTGFAFGEDLKRRLLELERPSAVACA
ncbi:MAG: methylated-DNA--[protein]-cysteine S-methyltransferase [Verrucomicrobia bacterium]|nr:methylated-DNA--[protein]-cysteine S-methyltransferase [Verrucomicrobiota bacterium]